jgi:hypothetical protein
MLAKKQQLLLRTVSQIFWIRYTQLGSWMEKCDGIFRRNHQQNNRGQVGCCFCCRRRGAFRSPRTRSISSLSQNVFWMNFCTLIQRLRHIRHTCLRNAYPVTDVHKQGPWRHSYHILTSSLATLSTYCYVPAFSFRKAMKQHIRLIIMSKHFNFGTGSISVVNLLLRPSIPTSVLAQLARSTYYCPLILNSVTRWSTVASFLLRLSLLTSVMAEFAWSVYHYARHQWGRPITRQCILPKRIVLHKLTLWGQILADLHRVPMSSLKNVLALHDFGL